MAISFAALRGRIKPLTHALAGGLMLLAQCSFVLAQSAAILPPAKQQFLDSNGKPISGGSLFTYVPNTTSPKTTWQDGFQTVPNSVPITLDASGGAFVFGQGSYSEQLFDASNNLIWTGFTQAPGTSNPTGNSAQDTAPVGTVTPFSGFVVPTNWLLANGQAISRTTYNQLFSTITVATVSGTCNSGSPQIGGFSSTSQLSVGENVEASCLPSNTTITSIVNSTTIQVSNNATSTTATTVTVFPWGNGNGTTTFNVPDLRGRTFAGADAMGGTAAGRLTSQFYGASAAAPGVGGGTQSNTLVQANLPNVAFANSGLSITVNDPGHFHTYNATNQGTAQSGTGVSAGTIGTPTANTSTSTTGITLTINNQGSAASGGSSTPISGIQPTITVNYIIKALPANTGAGGVISLGGMFGDIICAQGLTCANLGGNNTVECSTGSGATMGCITPNSPPALGNTTPNTAKFSTLTVNSTLTWPLLNTTGVIGGALCATSAGTFIYSTGANCFTSTANIVVGTTTITGGTANSLLFDNAGVFGEKTTASIFDGTSLTVAANVASLNTGHANTWSAVQTFNNGDLSLAGSSSGNTLLEPAATASGTLTLPAATDQLVGRATTDTLTNKTFDTAGTGNVFKIAGTQITAISGNTATAATASGVLTTGHCVSINAGNFVDAGGACTTGGGGGTVSAGTATQFTFYASTGTVVGGDAAWVDTGTLLKAAGAESIDLFTNSLDYEVANAGVTGTTVNKLAKLTGAPSTAVLTATTDTSGILGIVIAGAGTTGNAVIATSGIASCVFDGATTAGDYVTNSVGTAGDCTDSGASVPTGTQVLGQVLTTNAVAGTYTVSLRPVATSAISSVSNSDGTLTISPTTGAVVASLALGHANTWSGAQSFNSSDLKLNGSSSGTTTLNAAATAGTTTATLPSNTGTLAELNLAQTWTAAQSFNSGDMKLNGSSSGTITLQPVAAAGTNTITLPAATDTVAVLGTASQVLSGGVHVTSGNQGTKSSGTFTVDCGLVPLQFFTNGGAFTLAAPANDSSCDLLDTNSSTAGTITFSGFTVGTSTGDSLDTTNAHKFIIHVERINSVATYLIKALQ